MEEAQTYKEFIENIINTRGRHGCGEQYHEKHHIVPRCLGGEDKEENYIDLYGREHFIAHKLLALENPNESGLIRAWFLMSHIKNNDRDKYIKVTAEEYEEARQAFAKLMHEQMLGEGNPMYERRGELSPMFGISPSEETRKKLSDSLTGKYRGEFAYWYGKHLDEETKQIISEKAKERLKNKENHPMYGTHRTGAENPFYGHKHSEETKKKISKARLGRPHPNCKAVICLETNEEYISVSEAARQNNLSYETVKNCCMEERKTRIGKSFRFKEKGGRLSEP